jgi:ubiquinone/menaquinone biosynthesis C-methylase UbiE
MDPRKQEEIAFHDKLREGAFTQRWSPDAEHLIQNDPLWSNFKYYAIERDSLDLMKGWLRQYCRNATVLDYCCGNGEESIYVAKHGARKVHGIDISDVSIRNCRQRAAEEGLGDVCEFQTMDAEALQYPDNHFDMIMEYGVLHHLDLDKGMSELARVLKPGGVIICTETLAHNPLIRWYRQRTPHLRTAWEVQHILGKPQFAIIDRHFGQREMHFFHLATIAAVPFRTTPAFKYLLGGLRMVDRALLRLPWVKWQAWQTVFMLSKPLKTRAT